MKKILLLLFVANFALADVTTVILQNCGGAAVTSTPASAGFAAISGAHLVATNPSTFDGFTSSAINTTGVTLLIVAVVYDKDDSSGFALSDSKSNTYTALTEKLAGAQSLRLFYCVNPTVGSGHTFTIAGTTVVAAIAVNGFSGNAVSPFDVQNGTGNNSPVGSIQPGNVAPTQDNELIISAYSAGSSSNLVTVNSSFTISDQVIFSNSPLHYAIALGAVIKGAGTSGVNVNPTWTITGGDTTSMISVSATFKAAP